MLVVSPTSKAPNLPDAAGRRCGTIFNAEKQRSAENAEFSAAGCRLHSAAETSRGWGRLAEAAAALSARAPYHGAKQARTGRERCASNPYRTAVALVGPPQRGGPTADAPWARPNHNHFWPERRIATRVMPSAE